MVQKIAIKLISQLISSCCFVHTVHFLHYIYLIWTIIFHEQHFECYLCLSNCHIYVRELLYTLFIYFISPYFRVVHSLLSWIVQIMFEANVFLLFCCHYCRAYGQILDILDHWWSYQSRDPRSEWLFRTTLRFGQKYRTKRRFSRVWNKPINLLTWISNDRFSEWSIFI